MSQRTVGIVFGGRSGEHEVSLKSASSVIKALEGGQERVIPIGITKTGRWIWGKHSMARLARLADPKLLDDSIPMLPADYPLDDPRTSGSIMPPDDLLEQLDVVFPVLHGPFGEDGTIQGLFEMARIPYVGCGVLASSTCMDKLVFKDIMVANDIPVVPWEIVLKHELSNMDDVVSRVENSLEYPMFCKPSNLGSSVGIAKVKNRAELILGIQEAAKHDRRVLVENSVENAREIEVSVLGNNYPETSVPGEILPSREFYDYESKYLDDGDDASSLLIPADLELEMKARICKMAIQAFKAVDGAGMARVDFLISNQTRQVIMNEINTIPGFTSISMYSKLWKASGIEYPALIRKLINLALEKRD